jgi:hypothetical protein
MAVWNAETLAEVPEPRVDPPEGGG